MKPTGILTLAALIVGTGLALPMAQAQDAPSAGTKRTDLQRHDLSVPGREVIQVLVEFAPGEVAARHSHPGEEIVYVAEGILEYALDGRPPVTLKAGDVLFIPYGTIHAVKNVGSGNAAELATYIVEKGKPLLNTGKVSAILRAVSRAICSRRHVGPDRACRVEAILANIGDETIVIPDHGHPVSGKSGLKGYRDMLVAIRANGASLK